ASGPLPHRSATARWPLFRPPVRSTCSGAAPHVPPDPRRVMRSSSPLLLALVLIVGCAPPREGPAVPQPVPAAPTIAAPPTHPGVREVPTPNAYRAALTRGTR